jgi:hypothetical protein
MWWAIAIKNRLVRIYADVPESCHIVPYVCLDVTPTSETAFEDDNLSERLLFMPVRPSQDPKSGNKFLCVLLKLVNKDKSLFQRIEMSSAFAHHRQGLLLAELEEETKARLPCLRYENGLHTIRII